MLFFLSLCCVLCLGHLNVANAYEVLKKGKNIVTLSGASELKTLVVVRETSTKTHYQQEGQSATIETLGARSYMGSKWTPAPPELLKIKKCNKVRCVFIIPKDGAEYRVYTSTVEPLSKRNTASRLLIQATFGPTKKAINNFIRQHDSDPESWLEDQIAMEATLHRAYYRKRTNPRHVATTSTGVVRAPCEQGSRWTRFTDVYNPDKGRVVVTVKSEAALADMRPRVQDAKVLDRTKVTDSDFTCNEVSATDLESGALFLELVDPASNSKTYYLLDRRMQLVDNSLDSPMLLRSPFWGCSSAPRSFINSASCVTAAYTASTCSSFLTCGSPGEVSNDPALSHQYLVGTGDGQNPDSNRQGLDTDPNTPDYTQLTKKRIWSTIALQAPDQLRQRVAWALAQVFPVSELSAGDFVGSEVFHNYYDIFVRNAFGNYRDVMREVSRSPMMGKTLTFFYNEAFPVDQSPPDENFAREVMQLFSTGIFELEEDGGLRRDRAGDHIEVYSIQDTATFARAWTGFEFQPVRENIEMTADNIRESNNFIDPMRINMKTRDQYPKTDASGGYIGDGYPLCTDLPPQSWLLKGAQYRYLGSSPLPVWQQDPERYADEGDGSIKRFDLDAQSSSLFASLCRKEGSCGVDGCDNDEPCLPFKSEVHLDSDLPCTGEECEVDTVRVLRLKDVKVRQLDGSIVQDTIYYEYIRQPCVTLAYYNDAKLINSRAGRSGSLDHTLPMCGNPREMMAEGTCCDKSNEDLASPICLYSNERVTYTTAWNRCEAAGKSLCNFKESEKGGCEDCKYWFWTMSTCYLKAQVKPDGRVIIVHNPNLPDLPNAMPKNALNFFRVRWEGDGTYPEASVNRCGGGDSFINTDDSSVTVGEGGCFVQKDNYGQDTCVCDTEVKESVVFKETDELIPTRDEVMKQLKVGSLAPEAYNSIDGMYKECTSVKCKQGASNKNDVKVYLLTGTTKFDTSTIFSVSDLSASGRRLYFRNIHISVEIVGTSYSFRNPPSFYSRDEEAVRDAEHEWEATIDYYISHPNTPMFISQNLISRFISSNPSPLYVKTVAKAFRSGKYKQFGTGERGDLAATMAAVLLYKEARESALDSDPCAGLMREPIIKHVHMMRALEFVPSFGEGEGDRGLLEAQLDLFSWFMDFGEMPYESPSIFNYYQQDFMPYGPLGEKGLVSPESQILHSPKIINFVNGAVSLVNWGLTGCFSGYGFISGQDCGALDFYAPRELNQNSGSLTFETDADTAAEGVEELCTVLTGGRLSAASKTIIVDAVNEELQDSGSKLGAFKVAAALILSTPEFHSTNEVLPSSTPRATRESIAEAASKQGPGDYKAIVYLSLNGGLDSANILIPYECNNGKPISYEQYRQRRGPIAMSKDELLPIDANSEQPCNKFGVHPSLSNVKRLYDEKDVIFLANTGVLTEPMRDKSEFNQKTKSTPAGLFSHSTQDRLVQSLDAADILRRDGVLGRMVDALQSRFTTASYSIDAVSTALGPLASPPYLFLSGSGTPRYTEQGSVHITKGLRSLSSTVSKSPFAETWSTRLDDAFNAELLGDVLDGVSLEGQEFTSNSDLGRSFRQVAKVIKANTQTLKQDRNVFHVQLNNFDTHGEVKNFLYGKLREVDDAIGSFEKEMKAQGLWDNVLIVQTSDFGRALQSNGQGSDHGWGGNYIMAGGAVKGGKIVGPYPDDLSSNGPLDVGSGRMIPQTSWDAVWHGVAQWFGVFPEDMKTVLPLLEKFEDELLVQEDLFDRLLFKVKLCDNVAAWDRSKIYVVGDFVTLLTDNSDSGQQELTLYEAVRVSKKGLSFLPKRWTKVGPCD